MQKTLAVLLFLVIFSVKSPGQNGDASVSPNSAKSHQVSRLEGMSVAIDGIIDEEVWKQISAANNFVQMRPNEGAPATRATDVRVLYDNDALYIAARMYDNPDSIVGELFRRDGDVLSDWFYVQIDSYFDRRTAFSFAVNPAGVKKDILISNDTQEDISWDAVWEASVAQDEGGWTAEFRIPFSQLRFSESAEEMTWGVNFQRRIARKGEYSFWSPVPGDAGSYVGRFGTLTGIRGLSAPVRFEIQPYVVSRLKRSPERVVGSPYYRSNDFFGNTGADFKYGVTSDFTLSGTVNPDFGQVEVDPAVVNLSAYEIFFPERRPFFVEGSEMFSFGRTRNYNSYGGGQYFYSRRIGRQPQRGLNATYLDVPDQTTILGAAKLSGKTASGLSIGMLDAVTQRESARYIDGSGAEQTPAVEPLTNYLVARVKKDFDGQTFVGGLLTTVNRRLDEPAFNSLLHSSAATGGIDFEHRWGDRNWLLGGFIAGSHVAGDKTVIERTQRSSVRYFQRPDADYLGVEPARTSLSGYAGEATIMKVGGGNWIGSLTYQEFSPGMELNDMGFASLADRRAFSTYAEYQDRTPGEVFRNYGVYAYSNHAWTFGGDQVFQIYSAGGYANTLNFWNFSAYAYWGPDVLSDKLTRGGPLMAVVGQYGTGFGVQTDSRDKIVVGLNASYREDYSGEYDKYVSFNINIRPTPAVQIQFTPQLGFERDTDQFIMSVADSMATATFGRRYVFADVTFTNLSLNTRVNWAFTPDLSLQVVIQPFIQARNFYFFKEFLRPGTYDFAAYGRDKGTMTYDQATRLYTVDPDAGGPANSFTFGSGFGQDDFNFRSLRANLVLRWEYMPGSTIFVVWQHLRSHVGLVPDFDFPRDTNQLLAEPSDNIFLLKLSFWIGR